MWNPDKDYSLAVFNSALHTLVGGFATFLAAGALAYLMVQFDPSHPLSLGAMLLWWLPAAVISIFCFTGIPILLVHFWTLYHLMCTDDSRPKLFFIALATHTWAFVTVALWMDFEHQWLRSLLCIGGLAFVFGVLHDLKVFPDSRSEPSNL